MNDAKTSGSGTALVRTSPTGVTSGESIGTQYLTFMLDKEVFAIGILAIKEIIEYRNLTVVPMMPAAIRGVINLRGAVVPVIDLAARFGRKPADLTKRTCIVIVELESGGDHQVVGVIVDAVNQVLNILPSEIEPPPAFGAKIRTDFIHGLGKIDGKFVILLDVNQVLTMGDLGAPEAISPGESATEVLTT